jgi:hypothetical protein
VEAVAELVREKGGRPFIWIGKNGEIPVLAALMQKARFYFGNDTGPLHMAAAVGIPVVGIFGGGHWLRFLPVGPHSIGLAGDLPCFGCGWDCIFGDAPCVRLVGVDDAKKALQIILDGKTLDTNLLCASHRVSDETAEFIKKAQQELIRRESICLERIKSVDDLSRKRLLMAEVNSAELHKIIETIQKSIKSINSSYIWKITEPIRRILDSLKK